LLGLLRQSLELEHYISAHVNDSNVLYIIVPLCSLVIVFIVHVQSKLDVSFELYLD